MNDNDIIAKNYLLKAIELKVGFEGGKRTKKDLALIVDFVNEELGKIPKKKSKDGIVIAGGETVSQKSIERVWKYEKSDSNHNVTYYKLLRSMGYADFNKLYADFHEKFVNKKHDYKKAFNPESIVIHSLDIGSKLTLGWYPHKYCIVKYLGDYEFEVIESEGVNSKVGDDFTAAEFYLAELEEGQDYPDIIRETAREYEDDGTIYRI